MVASADQAGGPRESRAHAETLQALRRCARAARVRFRSETGHAGCRRKRDGANREKKAPALRQEPNGGWMRGLCVPFKSLDGTARQKFAEFQPPASLRRTSSLTTLPSTCAPARLGHHSLHHLAHVLRRVARRSRGSPRRPRARARPGRSAAAGRSRARRSRPASLRRQILASPLLELFDRIPPLLDQRRDHLLRLGIVERAARLDLAVHQRRLGHPQRRQPHWSLLRIAAVRSALILSMNAMPCSLAAVRCVLQCRSASTARRRRAAGTRAR